MKLTFAAALLSAASSCNASQYQSTNSTFNNPILPGFHPDPSCIFVPELQDTFFCASSSFNAFPGIPIHASKDLQNWKLIGHALNREEQLPRLALTNRSTSGIWAPTIRYNQGTFWVVTTLVDDEKPQTDYSRWDNIIFKSTDIYNASTWSIPFHFNFTGYDTSPFWDNTVSPPKTYLTGAHAWQVYPALQLAEVDLDTGTLLSDWQTLWNGTGGQAPEGPHIYGPRSDGYYYLLAAEGGTGLNHMVTMARSKNITGPYEANTNNPVLSNANTTDYFQTVGHADLFQDANGSWWAAALSTRSGPEYINYPMGRETVLTAITWDEGSFPVATNVSGTESSWPLPPVNKDIPGDGPLIADGDDVDFAPGSSLPLHFTYWRFPNESNFIVSPEGHPHTLQLNPSRINLTALNGNYAGPGGQTFVSRRQQDTLFTYSVDLEFHPTVREEEAGVAAFLVQNHHLDVGVVMLPANMSTAGFPGANLTVSSDPTELIPQFRFRAISYISVPAPIIVPVPETWRHGKLRLEIKASNMTHYAFSVGPADKMSEMQTLVMANNNAVSWGFTGVLLGVYATSNGGEGTTPAYVSNWQYTPQGQYRS